MEQTVRVRKLNSDGTAEVIHIRESACSGDCHKCSGCGAAKETMLLTAENPIGARPGELVVIQSESAPVLAAAAVLYMMPLALFFLGFILGEAVGLGAVCGCAAFVLGIVLVTLYDRRMAKKKKTLYTITGYAHNA
jgi:sigma-E factor negative regulatory protein RseC